MVTSKKRNVIPTITAPRALRALRAKEITPQTFSNLTKQALKPITDTLERSIEVLAESENSELTQIIGVAEEGAKGIIYKLSALANIPIIGLFFAKQKLTPKELLSKLNYYDRGFDLIEENIKSKINTASTIFNKLKDNINKTQESKTELEKLRHVNKPKDIDDTALAVLTNGKGMMVQAIDNSIGKAILYRQLIGDSIKNLIELEQLVQTQRHEVKNDVMAQTILRVYQECGKGIAEFQNRLSKIQQDEVNTLTNNGIETHRIIKEAVEKSGNTLQVVHEASRKLVDSYKILGSNNKSLEEIAKQRNKILNDIDLIDQEISSKLKIYIKE